MPCVISGWFWIVSRLVYSSLSNSGGELRLILAPELVSSVNLTTAAVDNVTVGSGGNYQVPRSVPRPLGEHDTCCNCDS
jgi:hypothetical protein